MNLELIIATYRASDADQRMSMFLYYRELRDVFTRLEEQGAMDAAGPRGK